MKRALPFLLLVMVGCYQPKPLKREGFSLTIPARWHVVTDDKDYDPERHFSIIAPKETPAHAVFLIYDETLEPGRRVEGIVGRMVVNHPQATRTPFDHWGRYDGKGIELRYETNNIPMSVSFFAWSGKERSFVVIETKPVKYLDDLRSSFEKLAASFEMVQTRKK